MITEPMSLSGTPEPLTKPPDGHADRDTAATRHLCAGVYADRAFRRKILHRIHSDPCHRVAPSYGFDLVPVVQHAWRSWSLDTSQQGALCLVLVLGRLYLGKPVVVTLLCWLGLHFCARTAVAAAPDAMRLKRRQLANRLLKPTVRDFSDLKHEHRLERQLWAFRTGCVPCLLFLLASLVSAGWEGRSPTGTIKAAFGLLLAIAVVVATAAALRQLALNRIQHAAHLRSGRLNRRETVIDEQQSHTVVVYHRPDPKNEEEKWEEFDPFAPEPTIFVGSGQLVHRWLPPMVVQLLRPGDQDMREREYKEPPFCTHELVDHLRLAMRRAADPEDPLRLRLNVRDRVFLNERDIPAECDLLQGRPRPARLRQIIDDAHHDAHQFLEMQVSTDGELVTTCFLRAAVRGRSLSLDFAACALTRTPPHYQVMDLYGESGVGAVIRAALRALWRLPEETAQLVWLCGAPLTLGRAALVVRDRTVVPRRRLLVGSRISIREDKSLSWKDSRFDETRIQDEIKLVEQRLLKAAECFLDSREVDTSAFKRKAANIINNSGVLNMGGRLEMKNSAVGSGAKVQIQVQAQAGAQPQGGGS
ncbi:hypothetical protein [Actinomadura rupiterrae]|uniref:hypothetical protein n=1 Tax=Actinomadura rupiterrae TaxID=559627 RepID=UPI0020A3D9B1|nr:hypothetical protein [Actinomadura rupiterrae]MCP2343144.1 hypothetical protein [Actinomadura rupiterrae]